MYAVTAWGLFMDGSIFGVINLSVWIAFVESYINVMPNIWMEHYFEIYSYIKRLLNLVHGVYGCAYHCIFHELCGKKYSSKAS